MSKAQVIKELLLFNAVGLVILAVVLGVHLLARDVELTPQNGACLCSVLDAGGIGGSSGIYTS